MPVFLGYEMRVIKFLASFGFRLGAPVNREQRAADIRRFF